MKSFLHFITLYVLFSCHTLASNLIKIDNSTTCEEDAYIALRELYLSTDGNNWVDTTGWPDETFFDANLTLPGGLDMSTWFGIQLDGSSCVSSIDLASNQLNGTLPTDLGNLNELTYLHLGSNQLSGPIPAAIGNLSNLTYLGLYDNQLNGSIPPALGNLTSLTQDLNLRDNNLSGSIPAELGNLTNLVWLRLFGNQLSGSIPPQIGDLSSLKFLDLSRNLLTGNIPSEIANLSNLEKLWLNQNQLTGSIPPEFGDLANLEYLYLLVNQLSGCYDQNLMNLCSQLSPSVNSNLYISDFNNFDADWEDFCVNGDSTCIPSSNNCVCDPVIDRAALIDLYNATDGPNWINSWDLSLSYDNWNGVILDANSCVNQLILVSKNLNGPLPATLGNLTAVENINLASNQLTGSIPSSLGDLCYLERLTLNTNTLTGGIPSSLGSLVNLTRLELAGNQLAGNIPTSIGTLANLERLLLGDNLLTGGIPANLGDLINLNYFSLRSNDLSGPIPISLGNLTNVEYFYLHDNQLTDTIPSSFGSLSSLLNLRLDMNQLTGTIPTELGMLSNMTSLNLKFNMLTGEIPREISDLTNLNYIFLGLNDLSGCYHPDLSSLCTQLTLSNNNSISAGNNFDADWEDFCMNGDGSCSGAISMDIWVYDYNADTYDIIPGVLYDDTVQRFYTDHDVSGNAVEIIDNTIPDENNTPDDDLVFLVDFQPGNIGNPIMPITYINFLLPQLISDHFDDVRFPYSAIAKINRPNGNHQATGTMISPNHVLTARHSIVCGGPGDDCESATSVALKDLVVIPGFDATVAPGMNVSSEIAKVYYAESPSIDIVILELEEPVGECSGWMSYGFNTDTTEFFDTLMQKAGYPSTPGFVDLEFSGTELTSSRGIFDGNPISVNGHFMGQGGESGGPVFTTNNNDEYLVHGTLLGNNMNHHYFSPNLFYSYLDIIENTTNSTGSCFDFPDVCPDFVDLTTSETNLQNVNAKILLTLNENLVPQIDRVYESADEILMDAGFEIQPLNTSFLANINTCPD